MCWAGRWAGVGCDESESTLSSEHVMAVSGVSLLASPGQEDLIVFLLPLYII